MYNRSKLPIETEFALRKLCENYPEYKYLIDDALEEALDQEYREMMREDISLYRGYANSPLSSMMGERTYKNSKYRAKLMLCDRFNLPTTEEQYAEIV